MTRFHYKQAIFLLDRNGWHRDNTIANFLARLEQGLYLELTKVDTARITDAIRQIPLSDRRT